MNAVMRREAAQRFHETAQVCLATEAAGEGINLQFCHLMINYDIPWNPNRLEQRMGRIHRIGQRSDVYIFNFVATNTVEGEILERLFTKLDEIRVQLGDRVFDVIGQLLALNELRLEEMLREAATNIFLLRGAMACRRRSIASSRLTKRSSSGTSISMRFYSLRGIPSSRLWAKCFWAIWRMCREMLPSMLIHVSPKATRCISSRFKSSVRSRSPRRNTAAQARHAPRFSMQRLQPSLMDLREKNSPRRISSTT